MQIHRSIPACLISLCCYSTSISAVDPGTHISQYAHTAWRLQDGSFSGAPNAITQTNDGYLWIGTPSGLFRFDGVRFVPVADAKTTSRAVFSLLGGADGGLWIGTEGYLTHLKDGALTEFKGNLGRINAIVEDLDGKVWFTRSRSRDDQGPLCQVAGTKLSCKGTADGITRLYAGPLIKDPAGYFWLGSANLLTRWRAGDSTTFTPSGLKRAVGVSGIQALAITKDGTIWCGINRRGQGLGLQQFINGSLKAFVAPGLNGEHLEVSALYVDSENTLWAGTETNGIYRIHDGKVDHFSSSDGLSGDTVTGFYEDREGDLWVATTEGIDSFRDLPVLSFSTREGLSASSANSVLAARDGTVWIGNSGSLDYIREGKMGSIRTRDGQRITSLFEDRTGQLWVGIDNALCFYRDGRFEEIHGAKQGPLGPVTAFTEDRDGDIWVESAVNPTRLARIHGRKVQDEIFPPTVPAAFSLAADPAGGIWLGLLTGGLARYQNGHLETFVNKGRNPVVQMLMRPDGSILGVSSDGLSYWRDGTLKTATANDGLPCADFYGLAADASGVWLYSQCGLVHVPDGELQKWWRGGGRITASKTFDIFDGARPWRTPFEPHGSLSPDGKVWFANENVVQMLDPRRLRANTAAPPVHIEQLFADHKSYALSARVRLPARTRDLEIDYTALSLRVPQKVRFRYRLEGRDQEWQEPQTRRQAFYNDLPPGDYGFHVIACNNDGVWNETGATLEFSIAPAWFQTRAFFVLSVLSGIALLLAGLWLRIRQMEKALSARFNERLAERTRMARELHDTFLQTLQGSKLVAEDALEDSADPARMRRAMEQLSVWLARAIQEGRTALNSLRASSTQTNDLAEAFRRATEECRMLSRMEACFSVVGPSKELHPVVRDEIYRIGYEAIRNAYKHSNGKRLEVTLRYGRDLTVCVRDDGIGIDAEFAHQGRTGHFGLQGMRERAARIGGKLRIVTSPESGTEVTVAVLGRTVFQKSKVGVLDRMQNIFRRKERNAWRH